MWGLDEAHDRVGEMIRPKRQPASSGYHKNTRDRTTVCEHLYLRQEVTVLTLIIGILITIVLGAILFWIIDKFCPEARLAQLLKLLVVLVCLGSIVARMLPLLGYPSLL